MARGSDSTKFEHGFVRLVLVKPFIDHVRALGLGTDDVLATFALDRAAVDDPDRLVHAEIVYGIFNALAETAKDPHLGFHVGERQRIEHWPPFVKSVEKARTLGEFLTHFIEGVPREASSVRYTLAITDQGAVFAAERLIEPAVSPQHTEAFGVAQFLRIFERACGTQWDPARVIIRTRFTSAVPRRPNGAHVERKVDGALEFRFPAAWLFCPINFASQSPGGDKAPSATEGEVSLLRAFQSAASPMLTRLDVSLDDVAEALGLPPARLARALKAAGTSPAREIRRLRLEEAKSRLSQGQKISDIARQLGYSDPAHFTRFFRSQTGHSPRAYTRDQNPNSN